MSKPATSVLKLIVPAGQATAAPPIGPALGQRGIKAIEFCKQFNEKTKEFITSTPLPVRITCNADRTFSFELKMPTSSWLLKKAANIELLSTSRIVANLSVKALYEITKIKMQDPSFSGLSDKQVFSMIAAQAKLCGIRLVH